MGYLVPPYTSLTEGAGNMLYYAIIEIQFVVFKRVVVLHRFYCRCREYAKYNAAPYHKDVCILQLKRITA